MDKLEKNKIFTASVGRSPWFNAEGKVSDAYVIGIGGGSASGKTRVAREILKQLGVPEVVVLAQDNFYKSLTPEESRAAFQNEYDFDCPEAFDYEAMNDSIRALKKCSAVQIPTYSFTLHQKMEKTTYLYGATVIIVEGIFALHDQETRDLCDLKVFVQCDSDVMLARRLRRDIVERGRDAEGVIDQYLRYVKPSYDSYILPTSKFADVLVPGFDNEVSIDLIASHIRRQLDERKAKIRIREDLWKGIDHCEGLPQNLIVLKQTQQLTGIHTILRNLFTSPIDFIFFADRLSTLVIELALSLLPSVDKFITTGSPSPYAGVELAVSQLCGISILRSGAALEKGLRSVVRDVTLGGILIDSDQLTGESLLYHVQLPSYLTSSQNSARESTVLLLDSQIGTGSAGILAIRVLLDHGCREENIIFCCLLVSQCGGIWAISHAFPKVRIVTSAIDPNLEERWIWPSDEKKLAKGPKKVFAIVPGFGSFGERYYGAQ